jgi:hypothetical protein
MRHKRSADYRWELEFKPGWDGHAYFWDMRSQPVAGWRYHLAIADQSGSNPEETDDGILYVDFSRPIREDKDGWSTGADYLIPLVYPDGRKTWTIVARKEACLVAERFKMEIQSA